MPDYEDEDDEFEDDEFEEIDLTGGAQLDPAGPVEELNLPAQGDRNENPDLRVQRVGAKFPNGLQVGTEGSSRLITFIWLLAFSLFVFTVVTGVVGATSASSGQSVIVGAIVAVVVGILGWLYTRKDHTD